MFIKKYIKNVLVSIDQLVNTVAGGDPDETITSRCGKRVETCRFCAFLCVILNKLDKRHCSKYIETDEGKNSVWGSSK